MIPVAWKNKVRDTFACLSGIRKLGARWVMLSMVM